MLSIHRDKPSYRIGVADSGAKGGRLRPQAGYLVCVIVLTSCISLDVGICGRRLATARLCCLWYFSFLPDIYD